MRLPGAQVMRRMLSAISSGSKTFFQSSRISAGLPNSIALLQASEKTPCDFLEDHGAEHVHVAEQEVARGLVRHAAARRTSSIASRMTTSSEAQTVSDRPGSSSAICSTVTRCERMTGAQIDLGDLLAERIGLLRPLHQRGDDVLLGGDAAEVVLLGRHVRLVVEDRRMAGMGDEIGEVGALGQMAGEGRGGVEHDHHRAGLSLSTMPAATLPICVSGTARTTTSAPSSAASTATQVEAEIVLQARLAGVAHLDMAHVEARALEIAGKPVAHFAAGAEQCDRCHVFSPHQFARRLVSQLV